MSGQSALCEAPRKITTRLDDGEFQLLNRSGMTAARDFAMSRPREYILHRDTERAGAHREDPRGPLDPLEQEGQKEVRRATEQRLYSLSERQVGPRPEATSRYRPGSWQHFLRSEEE